MPNTLTLSLADDAATSRLGAALNARLDGPATLLLSGEIGAGKSHLARALIQARLGADTVVPSPSFTLVQVYDDVTPLWHVDLYRIGEASELFELGIDEMLGSAVMLIEWPERTTDWPKDALQITLTPEGAGRLATLHWHDAAWTGRLAGLTEDMQNG